LVFYIENIAFFVHLYLSMNKMYPTMNGFKKISVLCKITDNTWQNTMIYLSLFSKVKKRLFR